MPEEPKKDKKGTCPGCGSQFTFPPSMDPDERDEIRKELSEIREILAKRKQPAQDAAEDMEADGEAFTAEELRLMGLAPAAEVDEDEE